jgi:predicted restriction endonuclease
VREALKIHETSPRLVTFSVTRDLASNRIAREFLEQEYQGRCQVTGQTFPKSRGGNYFEALSLVGRLDAEYLNDAGNMLCLCPDMVARFMHGGFEWIDSIENKVRAFKSEIEGGSFDMRQITARVAGATVTITWSERHFLRLCALWNSGS